MMVDPKNHGGSTNGDGTIRASVWDRLASRIGCGRGLDGTEGKM